MPEGYRKITSFSNYFISKALAASIRRCKSLLVDASMFLYVDALPPSHGIYIYYMLFRI
jgi:hypothetical protein